MPNELRNKNTIAVLLARDEYIASNGGYTFDDVAGNKLENPALIDFDDTVTGNVKVTLASETVGTFPAQNLKDKNAHVLKVWLTGTDASVTEDTMFLWQ